jgi:sugar phosphate isomerase/epimerase
MTRGQIGVCIATLLADPMTAGDADVRAAGEAAAAAGIADVSVWAHHVAALEGSGLRVGVVEAAMGWANADAGAAAQEAGRLTELAGACGAEKIVAVCLEPAIGDVDHARRNLAELCRRAETVGAQVCVEFLPWTGVPDLATAWELVEPLTPTAGILLDTWHWVRQPGGPAPELLASIHGERIGYVQLCDASPTPMDDVMTEAMTARVLPGHGVVDFAGLAASLDAIGANPFVATEVFAPDLVARLGASRAASAMRDAATAAWAA